MVRNDIMSVQTWSIIKPTNKHNGAPSSRYIVKLLIRKENPIAKYNSNPAPEYSLLLTLDRDILWLYNTYFQDYVTYIRLSAIDTSVKIIINQIGPSSLQCCFSDVRN